jgi:DNA-binding transcriptional LysR family regulator
MPRQTPALPPNFRTLDLNLLRVFDEVMAERNLTRAARNLSLTQPAVSNALRRLRETLGDELVRRGGQGMEPTPRALTLWPAVREALRQLQESLVPSTFVPQEASDAFSLAMADATAAELMPGLIETLETTAPGVSLRVVPLATRDPRRRLSGGLLPRRPGRPDRTCAGRQSCCFCASAAVRRQIRLRDAQWPSAGHRAIHPQPLLCRPASSGQLFGQAIWLY